MNKLVLISPIELKNINQPADQIMNLITSEFNKDDLGGETTFRKQIGEYQNEEDIEVN